MGHRVDPFVIPIPRKFLVDPETKPFFEYLNRFLHDLYIASDGGTAIEDTQNGELYEPGIQTDDISEIESELSMMSEDQIQFDPTELEDADVDNRRYALLVD